MAPKNPGTKTAAKARSAAAKRGVKTKAYNKDVAAMTAQREQHEQANPEFYQDIFSRTNSEGLRGQISPAHAYHLMGYEGARGANVPGQMELPGMERHPDSLPTPTRWEEFSPEKQARVLKAAARFGVTPESAHRSLAAQIDAANVREGGRHASFYSEEGVTASGSNLPRTQVRQSAEAGGVRFGVHAMANAMTSPNTRFVTKTASGEVMYPNDTAAAEAVRWAKEGHAQELAGEANTHTGEDYFYHPKYHVPESEKVPHPKTGKLVKAKDDPRKYPVQGYPSNQAKAIDAVAATLRGASVEDAWGPNRNDPKIAPFHNAWVDPHGSSQFWVSDTHSGPAAFAPHLKGKQEDAYMKIDGIHAFHDHIARQVMMSRGLNSLSGMQSQHWSQEKTRSGSAGDVAEMTPMRNNVSQQFRGVHPDQGTLF